MPRHQVVAKQEAIDCQLEDGIHSFQQAIDSVYSGITTLNGPIVTHWARDPECRGVATVVSRLIEAEQRNDRPILPPSSAMPLLP